MQRLSLVPTPIGNVADITERALQVLRDADVVAAEDTRRTRALLRHYGLTKEIVRLDTFTMAQRGPRLFENSDIAWLAYVSDAGTPGISDPGAFLIELAIRYGVAHEVLPGPTAFVPALVLSGLPIARFTFEGFLPRKGSDRARRLEHIAASTATSVLYESPNRIGATLLDLARVCGADRHASVSREISKLYEETKRGTLGELAEYFADGTKGEVVVVISALAERGADDEQHPFADVAAAAHRAGLRGRELRQLLTDLGAPRNRAYDLVTALGDTGVEDGSENPPE